MDRRAFLKTVGWTTVALAGNANADGWLSPESQRSRVKNWVWITNQPEKSADEWKRSFVLMKKSGVHAIMPEVYDGRHAYFDSQRLPVKSDFLGKLLPFALAEGLEVHAWMWCLPCMIDGIMKKHPDWYNVNAKGESALDKPAYVDYYKFLDPGRPEVREWVKGTVSELASIAELKGVHLDYIRHPDAILPAGLWTKYKIVQDKVYPQYDYGYSQYERQEFKKKYGIDPLEIQDPTNHPQWMQFRFEMVTGLVNDYLIPAAHSKGKMITAAVFPGPTLARAMVRQDWGQWRLDAFLPMLYNRFYEVGPEWVNQQTREAVGTVKQPIYSGLFVRGTDEATFHRTMQMALDGGASGISIFSADAMAARRWNVLRKVTDSQRPAPMATPQV